MILLISFMTVSCGKSGGGSSEESTATAPVTVDPGTDDKDTDPVTDTPPTVPEPVSNVPALALSYMTNVSYLSGFDTQ